MKRILHVILVWVVTFGTVNAAESTTPVEWHAAAGKVKITPEKSFWLAGYGGRNKPADGVLLDIWAKVLVLEDAQHHKAVVITTDLIGFPKILADSVAGQIEKQCGLGRSQILLSSSHTHTGPVLSNSLTTVYPMDADQWAMCDQYTQQLDQMIVKTVRETMGRLSPATLTVGTGACEFAVNRRNNVEKDVPAILERHEPLQGPVDHSVPVLAVHGTDGKLIATLFLYACHNTSLDIYQYSGDYAGFAQAALEAKHPGAIAMFAMGCGADQNPLPRRKVELCQKYGNQLAESVENVLAKPMKPVSSSLSTEYTQIDLPYDGELKMEELEKNAGQNDYIGRWAKHTLEMKAALKAEGKELPKSYPSYPVQVWRLGEDQYWITLGGEVVVDYSLLFKEKYGPATWVFGYANDVMAYIPNTRIWQEGRYEANAFSAYGIPAVRWCPDIEKRITMTVEELMQQARLTR